MRLLTLTLTLLAVAALAATGSPLSRLGTDVELHELEDTPEAVSLIEATARAAVGASTGTGQQYTRAEIVAAFTRLAGAGGTLSRAHFKSFFEVDDAFFASVDTDGNGTVDVNEFVNKFWTGDALAASPATTAHHTTTTTSTTTTTHHTSTTTTHHVAAGTPATTDGSVDLGNAAGDDGVAGLVHAKVSSVNWHRQYNTERQHTLYYNNYLGTHKMVVRRATSYRVELGGPATMDWDRLTFSMHASANAAGVPIPNVGRAGSFGSATWGCKVKSVSEPDGLGTVRAVFSVYVPAHAGVGEYDVHIESPQFVSERLGSIVVLFNPFSRFDETYLEDIPQRDEYVLADNGRVWTGDAVSRGEAGIGSRPWAYHQFELLPVILKILRTYVNPQDRGSPAMVARTFSWALNNINHEGVLAGRWDGDYADGERPSHWSGSRTIFQNWYKTGRTTRYGQCWVFSGIMTSAMRSLGIPCRSVTNFRSAHDSAPYDHVIELSSGESVWNFHVWNEVWTTRHDRGRTKAEWNAVDATPQEESDGKYQMGPAAISDIAANARESFDASFVISEVNALVWLRKDDYVLGPGHRSIDFNAEDVGRYISTLRPGCRGSGNSCRLDLTSSYKKALSPFHANNNAAMLEIDSDAATTSAAADARGHLFETELTPDRPTAGKSFRVTVRRNALKLAKTSSVEVQLVVESISYTGIALGEIKATRTKCTLTPEWNDPANTCREHNGRYAWAMDVDEAHYLPFLGRTSSVRATVRVVHLDTPGDEPVEYVWTRQFSLVPTRDLSVSVPSRVTVGVPFKIAAVVRNPLSVPFTNVKLIIDTPDLDRTAEFDDVPAGRKARLVSREILVSTPGLHEVSLSLDTDEYQDLYGGASFEAVMPSSEEDLLAVNDERQLKQLAAPAVFESRPENGWAAVRTDDAPITFTKEVTSDQIAKPTEQTVFAPATAAGIGGSQAETEQ